MQMNLDAVDTDGAIREAAEEAAGDTRMSFLRKGAMAGGAALSGGAILSALVPGTALAAGRPPSRSARATLAFSTTPSRWSTWRPRSITLLTLLAASSIISSSSS